MSANPRDDLYAAEPGELLVLDPRGVAAWQRDDGTRVAVSRNAALTLAACASFAPIGRHLAELSGRHGAAPEFFAPLVQELIARGLLKRPRDFLEAPRAAAPPCPDPLIVIRSYERPRGLEALLASLADDARRHGVQGRRLAVVDDSGEPEATARTRALVRAHASRWPGETFLLGAERRAGAIDALLADVPARHRAACRALLDPALPSAVTGSRTWNFAVLLAAGSSLAILDDDTHFPLRAFPAARGAVELANANEPVARWFDAAPGDAVLPPLEEDAYAALARSIGQSPATVLARDGWDASLLAHRSPRELEACRADRTVIAAVPGTYGTIPLDSSVFLTHLGAASQRDLWRAPYRPERLAAERVAQGYEAPRLTDFASYTPLLVDARALLPFAGTSGRVDDTYFLMLLRAIAPDASFLHVPMLLGHADYARRERAANALAPLKLDRNAFVASLFGQMAGGLRSGDRARRLAAAGVLCGELAAAPSADIRNALLRWRGEMMARVTTHLVGGLQQHPDAPPAWREHAERVVAVNAAAALADAVDAAEIDRVRVALRQVAEVAEHWPAMWQRARASGTELAERIG